MKTNLLIHLLVALALTGCKKVCPEGTIVASNTSFETIHRLKIDGVVYAILYPGQSINIDVPEGSHQIEFADANNAGRGCEPVTVNVDPCGMEARNCSN